MSVKSGAAVTVLFTTANATTGALADADSTPVGTLYVDGTANAATVTETNISTGLYKAAVTLPTLTAGQVVSLSIAATVAGVAGGGVVWQDVADTALASDVKTDTAAILADTGTDGVKIAATQGAITWGQQKITASALGQGALHIVNSGLSGVGIYAEGQNKGLHGKASTASGNGIAGEGGASGTGIYGYGAYGFSAAGTTADLSVDITGNLTGSVGSVTDASGIADAIWDEAIAGHAGAGTTGAALILAGGASGTGSITFTYTLTDSGDATAIEGATVEVYSDVSMSTLVATGTTNTAGQAVFYLDAGTYYLRRIKSGYSFTNPDTETVA